MHEQAQSPNNETLFAQNFIDNLQAVADYNDRATGVGGAIRGFLDVIMGQLEDYEPPNVSSIDEADMKKQLVQIMVSDELTSMGISLFDSSAPGVRQISNKELQDKEKQPASLVMLITNGELFSDTITKLNPASNQKDAVYEGVNSLLSQTVSLIKAGYAASSEDERVEQNFSRQIANRQLDMFVSLVPKLVECNFGELPAYKRLSEYTVRYGTRTLEDYIGAENLMLFNAAYWQLDISADDLNERWNKAFAYLSKMRDDSSPLYPELFLRLHKDFDSTSDWLSTVEIFDEDTYQQDHEKYRKEMDEHTSRLEALGREPTFGEYYNNKPVYPVGKGYPQYYIDNLRPVVTAQLQKWEKLFPVEIAYYMTELERSAEEN